MGSDEMRATLQRMSRDLIHLISMAEDQRDPSTYVALQCALTNLRHARNYLGEPLQAILDHDLMPTEASTETPSQP